MTAENAKQKTNIQLQNTFKKNEILRSSVIGCPISALRFLLSWDFTLRFNDKENIGDDKILLNSLQILKLS